MKKVVFMSFSLCILIFSACRTPSDPSRNNGEEETLFAMIRSVECSPDRIEFGESSEDRGFKIYLKLDHSMKAIDNIMLGLSSPSNISSEYLGNSVSIPLEYDATRDLYYGTGTIKYTYEPGIWKIKYCMILFEDGTALEFFANIAKDPQHYMYFSSITSKIGSTDIAIAAPLTVSETDFDGEPPEITDIEMTPRSASGDTTVDIRIEVRDKGSGIYNDIDVMIGSPDYLAGENASKIIIWYLPYTAHNSASGVFEASVKFSSYHQSGTWKICYIKLVDNRGNTGYYTINGTYSSDNYTLNINGSPFYEASGTPIDEGVSVTNTSCDNICPEVCSLYIDQTEIPSSGGSVEIKIGCCDTGGSGIKSVQAGFASNQNDAKRSFLTFNPVSGLYEGSISFDPSDDNTTWYLYCIHVEDKADNYTELAYTKEISAVKYRKYYYQNYTDYTLTNFDVLYFVKK